MELTLRHLEVLCTVEEEGSIGRAATRLGVSQPALTALLQRVETQVGCRVFDRTRSGVVVTRPGRPVLAEARRVLEAMDAFRAVHRPVSGARGALRLGGHGPLLLQLVRDVAAAHGQQGGRRLTARTQKSSRLLQVELDRRVLDYAVVREYPTVPVPPGPGTAERELVPAEPLFVGMARTHRLAAADEVGLEQLREQSWAMDAEDDSGENQMLAQACARLGFAPQLSLIGDDNGVARSWVGSGQAVALFEARAAQDHELVVRPLSDDPVHCRLSLRWRTDVALDPGPDAVFASLVRVYARVLVAHSTYRVWWRRRGPRTGPVTAAVRGTAADPG